MRGSTENLVVHWSEDVVGHWSEDVVGHWSEDVVGHRSENGVPYWSGDVSEYRSENVVVPVEQGLNHWIHYCSNLDYNVLLQCSCRPHDHHLLVTCASLSHVFVIHSYFYRQNHTDHMETFLVYLNGEL